MPFHFARLSAWVNCARDDDSSKTGDYMLYSPTHLITHLNNFNFPLNGGYLIEGSNQVGVFITAFL